MAAKKGSAAGNSAAQDARNGSDAPAGFTSDKADFSAPWVKFAPGAVVLGRLLGAYTMPDQFNRGKLRHYVQVQLGRACEVTDKEAGDGATRTAERGEIVSLGITAGAEVILDKYIPQLEAGAVIDVYLKVTGGRTKTRGGYNVWPLDVRKNVVSAPVRQIMPYDWRSSSARTQESALPNGARSPRAGAPAQDDSDIPF